MKKIKTINKLLSSLTLLSPLSGIGFNNQYQNTQKVINENNNNSLNNYVISNIEPVQMGDIWVTVDNSDPAIITGYSSGTGKLEVASNITEIGENAFEENQNITSLDLSNATSLTTIGYGAFNSCKKLSGDLVFLKNIKKIDSYSFVSDEPRNMNVYFFSETPPTFGDFWNQSLALNSIVYVPTEGAKEKYKAQPGFYHLTVKLPGVLGDIEINANEKSSGSKKYTINSEEIFTPSTWEIEMTEGKEKPDWLSIDNQGSLYWTDQCVEGTYKFKIKSTDDLSKSIYSYPLKLVINPLIKPKSNTGLILGLVFSLGIPIILVAGFGIWYLTKKKKTTVKI